MIAVDCVFGVSGDQNTKRKKMMDECDDDDDYEDVIGGRGSQLTAKQKRMEAETPLAEKTCIDLIVLGLPFKTTAETCREYFKTFGDVVLFDVSLALFVCCCRCCCCC